MRSSMSMRYRSTVVVQLRVGCHCAPMLRLCAFSALSGWAPSARAAALPTGKVPVSTRVLVPLTSSELVVVIV